MASLYADENFDYPVVEFLRQRGHNVVTVQEAGRAGGGDPQVLADTSAAGRALLTCNRKDYARLHRQSGTHTGIISCTWDPDRAALADRIDEAIAASGPLAGQYLRIVRPP